VPAVRRKLRPQPQAANLRRGRLDITQESWQIRRLRELARGGSLAAGRELIRLAIIQGEQASTQHPQLLEPALWDWVKNVLTQASRNPRQSIGQVLAPPGQHLRPRSEAELIHAMSLEQEAYHRVRKALDEGVPLKDALPVIANELNALGYRSSNNRPLQPSSIRDRYYAVSRLLRRGN
jgi:hypothetical protein